MSTDQFCKKKVYFTEYNLRKWIRPEHADLDVKTLIKFGLFRFAYLFLAFSLGNSHQIFRPSLICILIDHCLNTHFERKRSIGVSHHNYKNWVFFCNR